MKRWAKIVAEKAVLLWRFVLYSGENLYGAGFAFHTWRKINLRLQPLLWEVLGVPKAPKPPALSSVEQEILTFTRDLQGGSAKRAGHLLQVAVCSLKWLVLKGESDTLRLQATKVLLELPPVQERLGAMTRAVQQHYHQHLHVEGSRVNQALLAQFEKLLGNGDGAKVLELLAVENPAENSETPAIPLKTDENR